MKFNAFLVNRIGLVILTCFALTGCSPGSDPNMQTMLINLSRSYPQLWELATAIAYVVGFALALKALYALKSYGESRTMMSSGGSLKTPLAYLFASAMLIASPTAFHIINYTFFDTPNILAYSGGTISGWSQTSTYAVIGLIQFAGLVAFIRGWLYMAKTGEQGNQPGSFGKGLTHIIGGILAINIVETTTVLQHTFGFGTS